MTERFANAPPHLGCPGGLAQWSLCFDGDRVEVGREPVESPDVLVEGDYQAGLALAQVVGALAPGVMARAHREVAHLFGPDAVRLRGQLKDERTAELLGLFHDHMARMTVENPDIAHRARALGVDRHARRGWPERRATCRWASGRGTWLRRARTTTARCATASTPRRTR